MLSLIRKRSFVKHKQAAESLSKSYFSTSISNADKRRVVCTGIGVVTPLGCGVNHVWNKLLNGDGIGIVKLDKPEFNGLPSQVAAFVPHGTNEGDFDESKVIKAGDKRVLSNSVIYALAAADEAISSSKLDLSNESLKERTGCNIGTAFMDYQTVIDTSKSLNEKGYRRVSPYFIPKVVINMASGHIAIRYGFLGPNHAVSSACSIGCHAIGDAMRFIRNNDADVMLCGGADAAIIPELIAGFSKIHALSTKYNETPELASRPFDKNRDGFVLGEGAGVLVLEEYEHALKRNAPILAEIMGYGLSGDAHAITSPRPDGIGAYLCMESCLRDANVLPEEISYVNCHATSTPVGDVIENKAIKKLFGAHAYNLQLSALKGAFGHLVGAAGAVETAMTIMALKDKVIAPTRNLEELDTEEGFDLDYVPKIKREYTIANGRRRIAIKNSFGFGGTNGALCIGEL